MIGLVTQFDRHAGWGTVRSDEGGGGIEYFFHCTAIADGSRHIDTSAPVTFTVVPGHNGRWEASAIETTPRERTDR